MTLKAKYGRFVFDVCSENGHFVMLLGPGSRLG